VGPDYNYFLRQTAVDGLFFRTQFARGNRTGANPANEYAADGITVNNVCPGFTRTARLDNLASPFLTHRREPQKFSLAGTRNPAGEWHAGRIRRSGSVPRSCVPATLRTSIAVTAARQDLL